MLRARVMTLLDVLLHFFGIFEFSPKQAILPYYSLCKIAIFHTIEKLVNFSILAVVSSPFLHRVGVMSF